MRRNLRQQTRMMHGVISQFVPLIGQLLPFGLALLPRSHPGGHEERSVEMMFLENGTNEIEVGVDAIVEGEGYRGNTVLWPTSHAHFRCAVLGPDQTCGCCHDNPTDPCISH